MLKSHCGNVKRHLICYYLLWRNSNITLNGIVGRGLISLLPLQRVVLWEPIKRFSISQPLLKVSRAESGDKATTDTVHGSESHQVPAVVEKALPWTPLSKVLCAERAQCITSGYMLCRLLHISNTANTKVKKHYNEIKFDPLIVLVSNLLIFFLPLYGVFSNSRQFKRCLSLRGNCKASMHTDTRHNRTGHNNSGHVTEAAQCATVAKSSTNSCDLIKRDQISVVITN